MSKQTALNQIETLLTHSGRSHTVLLTVFAATVREWIPLSE